MLEFRKINFFFIKELFNKVFKRFGKNLPFMKEKIKTVNIFTKDI